mgnify:CR=1 FL=1
MLRFISFFLILPLWAQAGEREQSEAVISAKDEVELEESAMVSDALKRRSDLSFSNIRVDGEESSLDLKGKMRCFFQMCGRF